MISTMEHCHREFAHDSLSLSLSVCPEFVYKDTCHYHLNVLVGFQKLIVIHVWPSAHALLSIVNCSTS